MRILVSAGEASGDRYAAGVVSALRRALPDASYFGCGGPRMREAGVEAVVRTEDLSVVGLFEVLRHIPRIHGLYRKLVDAAARLRPDLAILTDAPDFHLRLASRLRDMGVPVAYYVAPQVWAWRRRRIGQIRRLVDHLLVIFPFEEEFFRQRGVEASFVGHPLSELAGDLGRSRCVLCGADARSRRRTGRSAAWEPEGRVAAAPPCTRGRCEPIGCGGRSAVRPACIRNDRQDLLRGPLEGAAGANCRPQRPELRRPR